MIVLYVNCSVAQHGKEYGKKAKGKNAQGSNWLREQRNAQYIPGLTTATQGNKRKFFKTFSKLKPQSKQFLIIGYDKYF